MGQTDFEISAEEFEGCQLIWVVFPGVVSIATISVAVSNYLALWETDLPVVAINDIRRLPELTEQGTQVLVALLRRNAAEPRFLGSTWLTGGDVAFDSHMRRILAETGRDPESVVATEDEAFSYLRACIARGKQ